ncbi:MAG TPA: serine O-acetyltransferase, partial [Thermoanaerobaculia bacterium]|nr:serine O-acetyltransferase [Thermoanaerobaculia bacterium]
MSIISRMREDIQAVFDHDPAARTTAEVVLAYPGLHALWMHQVAHWMWQRDVKLLARLTSETTRLLTGIEIHPGATIGRRLFIDHGMGVVIGETAEIGDDCTLYHGVTLGGTRPSREQGGQKRHPTIGKDVIVGSGAQVLGPIRVGDGARIGAAAVVVKEVPDGATMVGNPARQVGRRSATEEAPPMFEPYGITGEIPDPIARALNALLDEVAMLRARASELERAREPAHGAAQGTAPGTLSAGDGSAPAADPVRRHALRA